MLLKRHRGAVVVEMGLLLAFIAVGLLASLSSTGKVLSRQFGQVNSILDMSQTQVGAWSAVGGPYDYTEWMPEVTEQTENFTQMRTYKQDYERSLVDRYGETRIETKTSNLLENRAILVTQTDWENVGSPVDCSNYEPDVSTIAEGQTFEQTATCRQIQQSGYEYWTEDILLTTRNVSQTLTVTLTQSAVGTKEIWNAISNTYGAWSTVSNYSYSAYRPAINNQSSTFTQSRSYLSNQQRLVTEREQNVETEEVRITNTYYETRTISNSSSRTVYVAAVQYSCPSAYPNLSAYDNTVCYDSYFKPADSCPDGYDVSPGGNCTHYVNATQSCPSGYSRNGSYCYRY